MMESSEDDRVMEVETEKETESLTTSVERTTPGDGNINRALSQQSQEQAHNSLRLSQALFTPTQTPQGNVGLKSSHIQPTSASKHLARSLDLEASTSKRATPQQLSSRVIKPLHTKRTTPRTKADLPAFMQALLTAKARPAPKTVAKPAAQSNKVKDHEFVGEEEKPMTVPSKPVKPEAEQPIARAEKKMEPDSIPAPINDLFLRLGIGPSKGLLPTERVDRGYVSRLHGAAPRMRDESVTGEEGEEAQAATWAAEEESMEVKTRHAERR